MGWILLSYQLSLITNHFIFGVSFFDCSQIFKNSVNFFTIFYHSEKSIESQWNGLSDAVDVLKSNHKFILNTFKKIKAPKIKQLRRWNSRTLYILPNITFWPQFSNLKKSLREIKWNNLILFGFKKYWKMTELYQFWWEARVFRCKNDYYQ